MLSIFNVTHKTWENETTSVNFYELFADTATDLPTDPYYFTDDKGSYKIAHGSIAWVIDVAELYMFNSSNTWVLQEVSGGGGSGTTNYNALINKPSIDSVTLSGNKTLSDLGIQSEIDSSHKLSADLVVDGTTNKFNMQADWNQSDNTSGDYIKNKPTLGTAAATDATAYATAAQGTKADSAIQSVKVGGTALTPDSNKAVDITSIPSSVTATTQSQKDNSTKIATTAYVDKAVDDLPEPMVWTGTITITADESDTTKCSIAVSKPSSASNIKTGFTYKIASIADTPVYTGTLKVGDTMIAAKDAPTVTSTWVEDTDWNTVPSGDEPSGTVMSVTASNGLKTASGTAITDTGDIQANLASTTALSGDTIYNVGLNSNGNLAVKVPTVSKTAVGLTPQLPNESSTTKFLRQDGSWEVPAYTTVAEGTADGTVKVNGTDVSVHGLGTAAYTAGTSYIAAAGSTPTEDDIVTWNTTKTTVKDSGKKFEASASGISDDDAKIPTSKNIKTNVSTTSVLTGYTASTATTWQDVAATDTIQNAIKKVEKNTNLNKNNILYNTNNGVKNVLDFQTWVANCSVVNATKTVGANTINIAAASSNSYTEYLSNYPTNTDIKINEGDIYQLSWTYSRTGGSGRGSIYAYAMDNSNTVITSANAQGTTGKLSITMPTGATKLRISIAVPANTSESYGYMMICQKSLYDADSSYQPYAMSNVELTEQKADASDVPSKLERYIANTSKTYTLASNTPYIITVNSYGTYGMFMAFKYSDETTPRLYEIKKSSSFDSLITVSAVASSSDISIAPVSSSTWYVSSGMKL